MEVKFFVTRDSLPIQLGVTQTDVKAAEAQRHTLFQLWGSSLTVEVDGEIQPTDQSLIPTVPV